MKALSIFIICIVALLPTAYAVDSMIKPTSEETLQVEFFTEPETPQQNEETKLKINFINPTKEEIQEHIDYKVTVSKDGETVFGPTQRIHTATGTATIPVELAQSGNYKVLVEVDGILFQPIPLETVSFDLPVGQDMPVDTNGADTNEGNTNGQNNETGGGCLIATAAYGSELAPEIQHLRELRENMVMKTDSGSAFLNSFNDIYYSFSPQIADFERENVLFREGVKVLITPMVKSLMLLNLVEIDSEAEMIGYGSGIILLNVGMYIGIPAFGIKWYKTRKDQ